MPNRRRDACHTVQPLAGIIHHHPIGRNSPAMAFRIVDLPDPDGPNKAVIPCAGAVKVAANVNAGNECATLNL